MKEPVEYKLKEPIVFGSESIDTLTFKPIKAKHMRQITGKSDIQDTMILAQLTCGLTTQQFDEIGIADLKKIREIISDFLGDSPETGSSS